MGRAETPGRRVVIVVFAGVLAFGLLAWLSARAVGRPGSDVDAAVDPDGLVEVARALRGVQRAATPSTVMLRCPRWVGAGFFVAPELVLTNAHVLCGRDAVDVELADGRRLPGRPGRIDRDLDLATVEVPGAAAVALPLGDATELVPGAQVLAIGSPLGAAFTAGPALVSSLGRPYFGLAYVEVKGDVAPGSSGGPLLDATGRVVGIVSAVLARGSGVGLALPVNYAYSGDAALLDAPTQADEPAWEALLGRAALEDRDEVGELAGAYYEPGLVAAALTSAASVEAVLLQRFAAAPRPASRGFAVERDGEAVCRIKGRVERWTRLGALRGRAPNAADLASRPDALWRWLARTGLAKDLWVGVVRLDVSACSGLDDAELTLSHGEPTMDRVALVGPTTATP